MLRLPSSYLASFPQPNERFFFFPAYSTKAKNLSAYPLIIFWTYCIYPSMSFISDSRIRFCWSFACCCFLSLFSCKWLSYLCLSFLTCCTILLDMSREWGDNFPERSLIKRQDWIVKSSIFSARFLFRLDPLSTEAYPWLIVKITCKVMFSSPCKETSVNSLKKKSSNLCLLGLKAWFSLALFLNRFEWKKKIAKKLYAQ